ncbi:hypothetical protein M422DRAFT_255904 [Sphaerobolus stellatus SS14]|uniref:Uncharacterized protein n=1 Tax=Sphaerobolus stellatus (strain SS14) TaxID=990650 RepID=A0A0C9V211_SPHS4|nr:hypothetical protein M422DRAFT_255904 [Sphaerobolus stellatus SS14]
MSSSVLLPDSLEDIDVHRHQELRGNTIATLTQNVLLHPTLHTTHSLSHLSVQSFHSTLTEEERDLLHEAMTDLCSLSQSIEDVSTESDMAIAPLGPSNPLRNSRLYELLNITKVFDAVQANHMSNAVCLRSIHTSSTALQEGHSSGNVFCNNHSNHEHWKDQDIGGSLDKSRDIAYKGIQMRNIMSAFEFVQYAIDEANKEDFLRSHNSLYVFFIIIGPSTHVELLEYQNIYGSLQKILDDPLRHRIEFDINPHWLPYKKRTELETPRTFWVSLLHKLDATAQKVVNKITPVKPAVKFFDNFQGKQKLDLKKTEHHCRVDYGPPEGGAMKLNCWSSNPVLRTVEPHNAMHIGADNHIERIESSLDTTPQQSVSSSDRIGANWIE